MNRLTILMGMVFVLFVSGCAACSDVEGNDGWTTDEVSNSQDTVNNGIVANNTMGPDSDAWHGCESECGVHESCIAGECTEPCPSECQQCDPSDNSCRDTIACSQRDGLFDYPRRCNATYRSCETSLEYSFNCKPINEEQTIVSCDCYADGEKVGEFEWDSYICTGCDFDYVLNRGCGLPIEPRPMNDGCRPQNPRPED